MKMPFIKKIIFLLFGLLIAGGLIIASAFAYFSATLPTIDEISRREVTESTKIYDRTGEKLLFEVYEEEKRTVLPFEKIPDVMKKATIAVEDKNFYTHSALDLRAFTRVVFINLTRGFGSQGGSTITQQLAKNAFLTREKTVVRKIKELILSYRIEHIYSKDEILGLYLNLIPYGQNAYGVEAASQVYFGKKAEDLNLSEAAMLASLPQAPSYYSPWGTHSSELEERRLYVLGRMRVEGYIDEQQEAYAASHRPEIKDRPIKAEFALAPHFTTYVNDYLSAKYGEEFVSRSGLRVITTLDAELQETANRVVKEYAERNTADYGGHNAALIAEDPKTGQILAMVGSKDFSTQPEPKGCTPGSDCRFEGQFNVVTQGLRQPGSSFKPFVYMTAFSKGFTPETILFDVPTEFAPNRPECPGVPDYNDENTRCYHPQNYDLTFSGPLTMKESLARSINITAVKTLYLAGLDETLKVAENIGITTLKDRSRFGLSLVLGGGEVKMTEMATAYSTLATDGIKHKQAFILKIEDKNGRVLEEYEDKAEQVVDPNYPRMINSILSDRNLRSELFHASLYLTEVPGYQIALKTGTTNNYVDAWAFGYTPNLVVGAWAGNNDRTPLQRKGSSILAAIPMWHAFIEEAVKKRPNESFIEPQPVSADIPILRGELDRTNVHNILYFLNRLDDPQYQNWEEGVQGWLKNNLNSSIFESLQSHNSGLQISEGITGSNTLPGITLISPKNGDFIGEDSKVEALLRSDSPIQKIGLYLNGNLVGEAIGGGTEINYQSLPLGIFSGQLKQQNVLKLRIADAEGKISEKEIIVYR